MQTNISTLRLGSSKLLKSGTVPQRRNLQKHLRIMEFSMIHFLIVLQQYTIFIKYSRSSRL